MRFTAVSVVLLGACSTSGETPSDAAHESAPAAGRLVAASDCRASSRSVRVRGTLPAGSLVATSDSTGTGLLVTNTSQWTMLMVPAETSTVIEEAPYSNPTDTASRLALDAVARADLPHIELPDDRHYLRRRDIVSRLGKFYGFIFHFSVKTLGYFFSAVMKRETSAHNFDSVLDWNSDCSFQV